MYLNSGIYGSSYGDEMTKIHFKAIPWKIGNSTVVTLPRDYIKNKILPSDTETEFSFEVQDERTTTSQ